jgi:hypothetical protein
MMTIPCPGCGRALNLPETVRGEEVRCPACAVTFQAADEPVEVRPAEQTPAFQPRGAGEAIQDAGRLAETPQPERAVRSALGEVMPLRPVAFTGRKELQHAADLLWAAVMLNVPVTLCCHIPGLAAILYAPTIVSWPLTLLVVVSWPLTPPQVVILFGQGLLRRQRGHRLAQAAGELALLAAPVNLGQAGLVGFLFLQDLVTGGRMWDEPVGLLLLFDGVLLLVAALCGAVGGARTLTLLSRPDVRAAFQ